MIQYKTLKDYFATVKSSLFLEEDSGQDSDDSDAEGPTEGLGEFEEQFRRMQDQFLEMSFLSGSSGSSGNLQGSLASGGSKGVSGYNKALMTEFVFGLGPQAGQIPGTPRPGSQPQGRGPLYEQPGRGRWKLAAGPRSGSDRRRRAKQRRKRGEAGPAALVEDFAERVGGVAEAADGNVPLGAAALGSRGRDEASAARDVRPHYFDRAQQKGVLQNHELPEVPHFQAGHDLQNRGAVPARGPLLRGGAGLQGEAGGLPRKEHPGLPALLLLRRVG